MDTTIYTDPAGPITLRDAGGHTTLYAPGEWRQGVWQATAVASLPEAVREAAEEHWTAARVASYRTASEPPVPTRDDLHAAINAERQRRIEAGKVIEGVYVTGRDEDARNLTNLALAAQMRIAGGDTATITVYRDGNNVGHELTPPQVLSLWQQSSAYVSDLYAASWAVKAMEPLPVDVTADELWPVLPS